MSIFFWIKIIVFFLGGLYLTGCKHEPDVSEPKISWEMENPGQNYYVSAAVLKTLHHFRSSVGKYYDDDLNEGFISISALTRFGLMFEPQLAGMVFDYQEEFLYTCNHNSIESTFYCSGRSIAKTDESSKIFHMQSGTSFALDREIKAAFMLSENMLELCFLTGVSGREMFVSFDLNGFIIETGSEEKKERELLRGLFNEMDRDRILEHLRANELVVPKGWNNKIKKRVIERLIDFKIELAMKYGIMEEDGLTVNRLVINYGPSAEYPKKDCIKKAPAL